MSIAMGWIMKPNLRNLEIWITIPCSLMKSTSSWRQHNFLLMETPVFVFKIWNLILFIKVCPHSRIFWYPYRCYGFLNPLRKNNYYSKALNVSEQCEQSSQLFKVENSHRDGAWNLTFWLVTGSLGILSKV